MERFWAAIAQRYPGRVTISWPKIGQIPQILQNSGARFLECDFADLPGLVKEHGFRHVYLTDRPYRSATYRELRRAGARTIIVHDHTPGERSKVRGLRRVLKSLLMRGADTADAYIACSDTVMRRFHETGCLPREKCYLARNGIDLDVRPEPVDIRNELGLPADAVIVVSVGRATTYKGIPRIVEAAALVPAAHFVHAGDGEELESFRRKAPPNMHFLGRRSDVAGILERSNIAVHASDGEGLSLAILEFQRAGLAIVLPDSPTVSQSVRNGVSALLYPPGNAAEMAKHVYTFVTDVDLRRRLGEAAKEDVRAYDIRKTVAEVVGVFEALGV